MIVTSLKGGLGNQLFQYAIARHLASIHNTIVKMDVTVFATYEHHDYALAAFNLQEHFATEEEIASFTQASANPVKRALRSILRPGSPTRYVREKDFRFDPKILRLPDDVYLSGYWQSEKYFVNVADLIRSEISVKSPQDGLNREIAGRISDCNSVSVHVRRGTYLLPQYSGTHPVCSPAYYQNAVAEMRRRVGDIQIFVFSDDPAWAKGNLDFEAPTTFIDHNGPKQDYEELRLMSQCRHHIIANSTFSWWGAWLNRSHSKTVLAPENWFAGTEYDVGDLLPESWIRIPG